MSPLQYQQVLYLLLFDKIFYKVLNIYLLDIFYELKFSRLAAAKHLTVNTMVWNSIPTQMKMNYFYFLALVIRQYATLSFAP